MKQCALRPADEAGFSLMEALVALLVIGIAAAGVIRATQGHVDSVRDLELRAAAQWVAENQLVELALVRKDGGGGEATADMLGRRWRVGMTLSASADPDLRLATVRVRAIDGRTPLVTLRGFVDAGTVTP